jgi:Acetyltransferase (GNAT) domain
MLRPIRDEDLDAIFEQMRDPDSVRMAAFTAADPDDRAAFDAHMHRFLTSAGNTSRAITADGALAGTIASFVVAGDTEVTYWIDKPFCGRGIAGQALAQLLDLVPVQANGTCAWTARSSIVCACCGLVANSISSGTTGSRDTDGLISLTSNEIRRLFASLVLAARHRGRHIVAWSDFRRRRQDQARDAHYRKRLERLKSNDPPQQY